MTGLLIYVGDTDAYFLLAPCAGCGGVFPSNPYLVPSVVKDGRRKPVCRPCVDRLNAQRTIQGLAPVVPLPGAYEPVDPTR